MQLDKKIRIIENSGMARLAAWRMKCPCIAMTWGNRILLHNATREEFLANPRWVKHELAHVEQFRRYGFLRFLFLYTVEYMRKGYYANRFEVEARKAEDA